MSQLEELVNMLVMDARVPYSVRRVCRNWLREMARQEQTFQEDREHFNREDAGQ